MDWDLLKSSLQKGYDGVKNTGSQVAEYVTSDTFKAQVRVGCMVAKAGINNVVEKIKSNE